MGYLGELLFIHRNVEPRPPGKDAVSAGALVVVATQGALACSTPALRTILVVVRETRAIPPGWCEL